MGIAVGREAIDDRASGITEAEELGDFVESFAGGIVAGTPQQAVLVIGLSFEQVGVASTYD
jgi:hypothetical protein